MSSDVETPSVCPFVGYLYMSPVHFLWLCYVLLYLCFVY